MTPETARWGAEGMKVTVTKSFSFDSAHQLPWHGGKCRNLHGHTYRMDVSITGPLNESGIVIDFDDISEVVKRNIIARFDHQLLNDYFPNPTAEIVALEFTKLLEAEGLEVQRLTLWETPTSSATVEANR
jgi:6-pyruvoyltetrahydropterin/6-carboxytetrahydropterin synthase